MSVHDKPVSEYHICSNPGGDRSEINGHGRNDNDSATNHSSLTVGNSLSKEEILVLLEKYKEKNIELLQEKRHLLLEVQDNIKLEGQLLNAKQSLDELNAKIEIYEKKNNAYDEDAYSDIVEGSDECRSGERSDLQRYESNKTQRKECNCGASKKLAEVIRVNHIWQQDYLKLQAENVRIKAQISRLEKQVKELKKKNCTLENEVDQLSNHSETSTESGSHNLTADDIEAIKQQMAIFKDDYEQEVKDSKKLKQSSNELQQELYRANNRIDELTNKNKNIKEKYRRVSYQKEHLLNELRRLSTAALPLSPVATNSDYQNAGFDLALMDLHTDQRSPRNTSKKPPEFYYVERDGARSNIGKNQLAELQHKVNPSELDSF